MRIEIRNETVLLDGYINVTDRDSKPVLTPHGKVIERIEPRAFERALGRARNVDLLLNHNKNRKLGSTGEGNLTLFEDNIGLRGICTVSDPEVKQKAEEGKLKGWSFGMYVNRDAVEQRAGELPRRKISELDLFEVSILDETMTPCYLATSIEQRSDEERTEEIRASEGRQIVETITRTQKEPIDYTEYEHRIHKLKQAK